MEDRLICSVIGLPLIFWGLFLRHPIPYMNTHLQFSIPFWYVFRQDQKLRIYVWINSEFVWFILNRHILSQASLGDLNHSLPSILFATLLSLRSLDCKTWDKSVVSCENNNNREWSWSNHSSLNSLGYFAIYIQRLFNPLFVYSYHPLNKYLPLQLIPIKYIIIIIHRLGGRFNWIPHDPWESTRDTSTA